MSLSDLKKLFAHGEPDAAEPPWKNQAEFAMLLTIGFNVNDDKGGFAWPSRSRLAKLLRMQERSVTRLLRELERRGLIETVPGQGKRLSCYRLVSHRGDRTVTSLPSEVTVASVGGDPTGATGDRSVASVVTGESPDLYVPGIDQEVSSALAARDTPSPDEENEDVERSARMALLEATKARIEAARLGANA